MARIFSTAETRHIGYRLANSQDSSSAVRVSRISLFILRPIPHSGRRIPHDFAGATRNVLRATRRSIPVTAKVDVDGKSRAQVLDHLIAFVRLGFEAGTDRPPLRSKSVRADEWPRTAVLGPVRFPAGSRLLANRRTVGPRLKV